MSERPSVEETLLATGVDPRQSMTSGSVPTLVRGTSVGRYVVLGSVGAGAMGVVYAAYDPELDRKVALKLLHASDPGITGTDGYRRLLREAQAMAKLNHPNTISVHDVGEHAGRVYLAMEFVEGATLRQWCASTRRSWPEVLAVLVAAGRGLAAAHASGLVHRDFKPDNVMVGDDGRVRVTDFGLAQSTAVTPIAEELEPSLGISGSHDSDRDAPAGTPAYMAPEQHGGEEVGPAADQFSFCVTLWEALYGRRPFAGGSAVELAMRMRAGRLRTPQARTRVPAWLRRVCERGLSPRPEQRFADMPALLAELQRGRTRARMRMLALGIGGVAMLGVAMQAHAVYARERATDACERAGSTIEAVWNDDRRAMVREGIASTDASHAVETADKVMPWLDTHAQAWADARTHACLDAEVERVWDEDLLQRALWCLDDRRVDFDALLTELASGRRHVVDAAVVAAANLGERLAACRDAALLSRSPAPSTDQRADVQRVRVELAHAAALQATGAYEHALVPARSASAAAEEIGWPPIVAESRRTVGELLERTGAFAEAERELEQAYFGAIEAGAVDEAMLAANALVRTVGFGSQRHEDGLRWAKHAKALRAGLPETAGDRLMKWADALAGMYAIAGDFERARALYEQALAVREEMLGPDHVYIAQTLNNLATIAVDQGRYAEARQRYRRALEIREDVLGAEHPAVADVLENLANLERLIGELEEAQALSERALALRERVLGRDHPQVAVSLANLGITVGERGDRERARRLLERALAIQEKAFGPEHPHIAASLGSLSELATASGELARARDLAERALAIQEKTLGPDHPVVAMGLANLAMILHASEAYAEARALDERALSILEKSVGENTPTVPPIVLDLAQIALAQGRVEDAAAAAERVVALAASTSVAPEVLDAARSVLSRANGK